MSSYKERNNPYCLYQCKSELANIIENYAQVVAEEDEQTWKKTYKQIFPQFHQLSVVKALLADARQKGAGQKYLIQHSAGIGKSNSARKVLAGRNNQPKP